MNTSVVSQHRRVSLKAGWLYLLTFVSIPTLALYGPVKGANYVLGSGPDTAAIIGGILEITIALAGLGTAVTLRLVCVGHDDSDLYLVDDVKFGGRALSVCLDRRLAHQ